jgi:glycosyltransferase involved in cell wall biosynthesis
MNDKVTNERPLVTFSLFAYNQERYIREAIEGAFAQTYEPLEVILSDDCSTDRTFEIMQEMATIYKGPHRIIINKNSNNIGLAAHVNKIVEIASGKFIAFSAGDDVSLKNRCEFAVSFFIKNSKKTFIETGFIRIDECGEPLPEKNPRKKIEDISISDYIEGKAGYFVGAARVYKRDALLSFPPLEVSCPTEDSPLLLRSLIIGTGSYYEDVTILRRIHKENLSSVDSLKKMPLIEVIKQYESDLLFAYESNFISSSTKSMINKWVGGEFLKRVLVQDFKKGNISKLNYIKKCLIYNKATIKSRISAAKHVLNKS